MHQKLRNLLRRLRTWFQFNLAVLRSWDQTTRTAGLGAIGVSVFASGSSVNPWSFGLGVALLIANTYIASLVGRFEAEV